MYNKSFLSILVLSLITFSFNCAWAVSGNSISTYFDTVQKTYIGYYQRPGDPGGLLYWAQRLETTNGNLNEIIEAYAKSAESQALYGTINSSNIGTVVDSIYMALFNRPAEVEGKAYYVNGFNAGRFTAATIMLNVLYGAQNEDLQSVNNKLTAANLFTRTIDPELDGANLQATYSGNTDAQKGRNFLSTVGWNTATIPTQAQTAAYIQGNIADPGDPIFQTFTVMIAQGGNVSVFPVGIKTAQYGEIIQLQITTNSQDVVPILLVNGQQVDVTKSQNIYVFDLTVVGNTSVYATSAVEPKIAPNVKAMDEATVQNLSSISEDGSVLTFNGITPYLESLQAGDVIIIGVTQATPGGFLGKITNITIGGSQITVETTDATVEDVIEEGEIIITKQLTASDITAIIPLVEGVTLQQDTIPGPLGAGKCWSQSTDFGSSGFISGGFSLCIDAKFNFALGIGKETWHGIPYPTVKNLVLSTTLNESMTFDLACKWALTINKEVQVAKVVYGAFTVGPLVFLPVLTVNVGIDAGLAESLGVVWSQNAALTLGIAYHNGDWSGISDFTVGFGANSGPTTHVNSWGTIYVRPQFDFLLYGVAGNYVELKGYFGYQMDLTQYQWLHVYGGISAAAGVKAGIWRWTLEKEFPLFDYREEKKFSGNKPPAIITLAASPETVTTGQISTIKLLSFDDEDDPMTCTWTTDGGTLSSTTACGSVAVAWTAPGTLGTYTVSVSATDNMPGHDPVSRSVTIVVSQQNYPPTIGRLTANPEHVDPHKTSIVQLGTSDPENNPLTCSWSATGGTLSSTTGCGSVTVFPGYPNLYTKFVTWTAPATPGTYTVSVNVTDNNAGHSPVSRSVNIYVSSGQPPTITSLTANPQTVVLGRTSIVTVVASDFENDPLTCSWSATGGSLSSTTGCGSVTWTAPATPGTYTVSVTVTDNIPGHEVWKSVSISVLPNQPPIITSLTAIFGTVEAGKTDIVTVVASDPENDPLACSWTATGGSLSSTTGCGSVTWTAPGTIGTYTVTVSITDNKPGHSPVSRSVNIAPNQPPTITSLTANPENVAADLPSTVTLVASDPENDPLTCSWTADGGTLSSTTGCGSVTWTAPSTPGTYTVSVSVTDNKPMHSPVSKSIYISTCNLLKITTSRSSYDAYGGLGKVTVSAPSGCPWTATTDVGWIYFSSPTTGTGSGYVNFDVAPNYNPFSRLGIITIAGKTLVIGQAGR